MLQCSSYAQTALFLFLGDLEKAWGEKQWLSDIQMTSLSASPHVPEEKHLLVIWLVPGTALDSKKYAFAKDVDRML